MELSKIKRIYNHFFVKLRKFMLFLVMVFLIKKIFSPYYKRLDLIKNQIQLKQTIRDLLFSQLLLILMISILLILIPFLIRILYHILVLSILDNSQPISIHNIYIIDLLSFYQVHKRFTFSFNLQTIQTNNNNQNNSIIFLSIPQTTNKFSYLLILIQILIHRNHSISTIIL